MPLEARVDGEERAGWPALAMVLGIRQHVIRDTTSLERKRE